MAMQTILRPTCLVIGIIAGTQAMAQNTIGPAPGPAAPPVTRPDPSTPVIHRQPRAADVPATADDSPQSPMQETPDDAAMNRMIRGICRGC